MDSLTKKITQGYMLSFISEKIDQHTVGFLNQGERPSLHQFKKNMC
jgi:hypothetical protein